MPHYQIKQHFKSLQKSRHRWLVALVATVHQTLKFRELVLIYIDEDGDWHNRRGQMHLVSPELNVSSWKSVSAATFDLWCHDYTPNRGDVVVDIGAGIGEETLFFARLVGDAGKVVSVEADPDTYRCLVKTVRVNNLANVLPLQVAISDENGFVQMNRGEGYLSNNILQGTECSSSGNVRVVARQLADILEEANLDRVELLKMNIEGAERHASSSFKRLTRRVKHFVISCHDFKANEGQDPAFRTFDLVLDELKKARYSTYVRSNDKRREVPYYIYAYQAIGA